MYLGRPRERASQSLGRPPRAVGSTACEGGRPHARALQSLGRPRGRAVDRAGGRSTACEGIAVHGSTAWEGIAVLGSTAWQSIVVIGSTECEGIVGAVLTHTLNNHLRRRERCRVAMLKKYHS